MIVTRYLKTPVEIIGDYGHRPDGRRMLRVRLHGLVMTEHTASLDTLLGTATPTEVHDAADAAPKLDWTDHRNLAALETTP